MLVKTFYFPAWDYQDALDWMKEAHDYVAQHQDNILIGYGSHNTQVITLGRSLAHEFEIYKKKFPHVYMLDRGGGATAHEPGQLVLYPVLNLSAQKLSVKNLIALSEQAMLNFLAFCNTKACLNKLSHGVFIDYYKIGFIGMRIVNNISAHGLALNLFNNAEIFNSFVPCNNNNLKITSLYKHVELKNSLDFYAHRFCDVFMQEIRS